MKTLLSLLLLTLIHLLLGSGASLAAEARVAVAANFTDAARALAPQFEKSTGHRIKISYGSTGKLYAQIENGAPFDVFLAADTQRPEKLLTSGLAVAGSQFIYARGKLVLWSAQDQLFENGETFLKKTAFKRIAIANPRTAPYGLAAQQVLNHLGIWQNVQARLVRGDSIAQTFQFVATGNAETGFVANSQIKGWQGPQGTAWQVPAEYYQPINQTAVLLLRGKGKPAAEAFIDYLKSDEARDVIEGLGYGVK
jgi:molybdate transport system substrate-binding protein